MYPMLLGLSHGVSELKDPEEGGPHRVEVKLRGVKMEAQGS